MAEEIRQPNESPVPVTHGTTAGHVVPARVLVGIWLLLIVLTAATVSVTRFDLGTGLNLWVALGIATAKASLVLLYFMHLRYDHPVNALVFIFALFFVALFIVATLDDSLHYQPSLIRGYAPEMTR